MNTLKKENKMGEHHSGGLLSTLISIVFAAFAFITLKDVQTWMSIAAAAVGIIAGIYAIRVHRKNLNK